MLDQEISKLTLYGDRISGNCLKIKWAADYCGLDHDWVDIDILTGDTRSEAFLRINPVGQVPVARWPDGRTLAQSNAICLYFAAVTESDLLPTDTFQRAQMDSWLFWEQYSHETAIAVRRFQKLYLKKGDDEIDPALMMKGLKALGLMEMQLSHTDWLVGDRASIADLCLVAYTRLAHEGGFDLAEFPAVSRWISRTENALGIT
ncbi:MAG: glutathione S-transferase family protein [Pseudomonadota bacterium]